MSVVTICVPLAQTVQLSRGEITRKLMSNGSRLLAAVRKSSGNLQRKTIAKSVRQHKRGILGAVGQCEEFDPVLVHRCKMEENNSINKMGVYDVVPRSEATKTGWVTVDKGSHDNPQIRAR